MGKKILYNKTLKRNSCENPECEKQEVKVSRNLFFTGFLITLIIFLTVFAFNSTLNDVRNNFITEQMEGVIANHENMQTLLFMSQIYGDDAICVIYNNMIREMNEDLWELGVKIDQYRETSENFQRDPFYVNQKKIFNRKSVLYFAIMNDMNKKCQLNKTIISYFYHKKEICPRCDAQSFVLSDLRNDLKKTQDEELVAIFSFDAEMGIPGIELLMNIHNITEYPALVINNKLYLGLHSKNMLIDILCKDNNLDYFCKNTNYNNNDNNKQNNVKNNSILENNNTTESESNSSTLKNNNNSNIVFNIS